jgi:hypothetical protein
MNLDQLLHVLRAASDISGEKSFVLIDAAQYPVENIVMWAERRHRDGTEARP